MKTTEQDRWTVRIEGWVRTLSRAERWEEDPAFYKLHRIALIPPGKEGRKTRRVMERLQGWIEHYQNDVGCRTTGPTTVPAPTLDGSYATRYDYGIEVTAICPMPSVEPEGGTEEHVTHYPRRYPNS